mgnify:CR=1 FL=1
MLLLCLFLLSCSKDKDSVVEEEATALANPSANHKEQVTLPNRSQKRGVAFNFQLEDDIFALYKAASWCYNWGTKETDNIYQYLTLTKIDFFPMAWGANFSAQEIIDWKTAHPECEYVLAFNEPNLTDQANITPQQAAQAWVGLKDVADKYNLKVVAPAMNYGTLSGYSDPIVWLDEFFSYVPKENFAALSIHCYMNSVYALKSYVERFKKYNLPIWMTEFCAWDGGVANVEAQMDYMCDVISYFEQTNDIERYAWFIPRTSNSIDTAPYMQLLTHTLPTELTPLGTIFEALPNLSDPALQAAEMPINVNLFSACTQKDYLDGKEGFSAAPHLRPTTDIESANQQWMINYFFKNQWVEYRLEALETLENFQFRYKSNGEPIIYVRIDNQKDRIVVLPSSSDWTTYTENFPLSEGMHTVRITMNSGFCDLAWFNWTK